MELPSKIDRRGYFLGEDDVVNALLKEGQCSRTDLLTSSPPDELDRDDVMLVSRRSTSLHEDHGDEPSGNLPRFLDSSYLVAHEAPTGTHLKLLDARPLTELLNVHWHEGHRGRKLLPLSNGLRDPWDDADQLDLALLPGARIPLSAGDELLGPVAVCCCGSPDCGAEYAWIKEGVCLCLATTSAGWLRQVSFFPFDVITTWEDPRWLKACADGSLPQLAGAFDQRLLIWVEAGVLDELRRNGTVDLPRAVGQPEHFETALVLDETLRDFPHGSLPQSILGKAFLSDGLEYVADDGRRVTQLLLESPFPVDELLRMALKQSERREIARMCYAPQLTREPSSLVLVWNERDTCLGEIHIHEGRIVAIQLMPL